MRKALCILLCGASLLSLLAGCKKPKEEIPYVPTGNALSQDGGPVILTPELPQKNQEMWLTYYAEKTLNPYECTDFTNRVLLSLLYQSLFVIDRENNISPMLCNRFTMTEDMMTYTFYAEQATFSDGTVLTDRDVAASLNAAMVSTVYQGRFTHVEAITALETGGVEVKLTTPMENLPMLLDIPIVKESQATLDRPLGTGPYILDEAGSNPILRRRDNWWCSANMAVTANAIALKKATDNAQIRDSFEFEGLSLVCADPGSDKYADFRCDYELWDIENNIFLYLSCNMNSMVFTNEEVRKAIPLSVDRDTIVADFYHGFARSATLPASPLSQNYNNTLANRYKYDGGGTLNTAVSNAEMIGKEIVFLVNSDDSLRHRVAKKIAETFTAAGLVVKLSALPTEKYLRALERGEFDIYLGQTKLSPNMDLSQFFSRSGNLCYGSIDNVAFYTMCTESLANYGNYYTLHQSVVSDGRLCPVLFRSYAVYATRGLVTDLTPARDNVFYYSLGKTLDSIKEVLPIEN